VATAQVSVMNQLLLAGLLLFTPVLANSALATSANDEAEQVQTAAAVGPMGLSLEHAYKISAYYFYLQDPYQSLLYLQLPAAQDGKAALLSAGLLLQMGLPNAAAQQLEPWLSNNADDSLPWQLRQMAWLEYARFQREQGDIAGAKQSLAKAQQVPAGSELAEQLLQGPQQQLTQLLQWPDIHIPAAPEFSRLADAPEMPYIVANQALALHAKGETSQALHFLTALSEKIADTRQPAFWQRWFGFAPPWLAADAREQAAMADYVQLLQAQLLLSQKDYSAALVVLRNFPQQSVLSQTALQLYAVCLAELRQIPTLLAVLERQLQQYPEVNQTWPAALHMGMQLEREGDATAAFAAYQQAEQFYQQQLQQLNAQRPLDDAGVRQTWHQLMHVLHSSEANRTAQPDNTTNANSAAPRFTDLTPVQQAQQLAQGWSPWQRWHYQQDRSLQLALTQWISLQQLAQRLPTQQRRIAHLQKVVALKQQQQQQLFATLRPQLLQQHQALQAQVSQLTSQLTQALAAPYAAELWAEPEQVLQRRLDKSKQLLADLAAADLATPAQQQRVARLSALLQWRFVDQAAALRQQARAAHASLLPELAQQQQRLARLASYSDQTPRLAAQQQQLAQLQQAYEQQAAQIAAQQQALMMQVNQRFDAIAANDQQQLQQLSAKTKQALARILEQQVPREVMP
jgi:hypothetical protein